MTCFVKTCKNIRRLLPPETDISFHRFPSDIETFRRWLSVLCPSNVDINSVKWKSTMYVCSQHFTTDNFIIIGNTRNLNRLAIPSCNLPVVEDEPVTSEISTPSPSSIALVSPLRKRVFTQDLDDDEVIRSKKAKYWQDLPQVKSSTSGSSGSTKRRTNHEQSDIVCPPKIASSKMSALKKKCARQKKTLNKTKETVNTLKKKITTLNAIVKKLQDEIQFSTTSLEDLEKTLFGGMSGAVVKRMLENSRSGTLSTAEYPEELRKFARTLHFYSARAYNYVRRIFHYALPHPSTMRQWSSVSECMPGFSHICFEALKIIVKEAQQKNSLIYCNVVLDEMSIKQQIDYYNRQFWGYTDIGSNLNDTEVEPAHQALVIMVVCLNASWKVPIAYFLIKSLTSAQKANIVREALIRLCEVGVKVTSITCDGPAANFAMFRSLGCNLDMISNLKTEFNHPTDEGQVFAILDPCHMLKLARNALAEMKIIVDPEGNYIKWEYIEKLHKLQDKETLTLANKLRRHIEWEKQKMKVNVAAQTFSNSVAEALLFLKNELGHPEFQSCDATVRFIKLIDKLCDYLNSRLPWVKGCKGPLRFNSEDEWTPFFEECMSYFLNLKDINGHILCLTRRKVPFLGFVITIKSVIGIFNTYVKTNQLQFLLMYKLSQDHLELFFCSIRSRNGWNNNPSALQFMHSYKKLLMHTDISSGDGTCTVLDTTSILTVTSSSTSNKYAVLNQLDMAVIRRKNKDYDHFFTLYKDHDYNVLPSFIDLNVYSSNIITYIARYLIMTLKKIVHCNICFELLVENSPTSDNYLLTGKRNIGCYMCPSRSVVLICFETEGFIRHLMATTNNTLPSNDLLPEIVIHVCGKFLHNLNRTIFPDHDHSFYLLKQIIYTYCKIRLHNLAKRYTVMLQGSMLRKKLSKLILFLHQ